MTTSIRNFVRNFNRFVSFSVVFGMIFAGGHNIVTIDSTSSLSRHFGAVAVEAAAMKTPRTCEEVLALASNYHLTDYRGKKVTKDSDGGIQMYAREAFIVDNEAIRVHWNTPRDRANGEKVGPGWMHVWVFGDDFEEFLKSRSTTTLTAHSAATPSIPTPTATRRQTTTLTSSVSVPTATVTAIRPTAVRNIDPKKTLSVEEFITLAASGWKGMSVNGNTVDFPDQRGQRSLTVILRGDLLEAYVSGDPRRKTVKPGKELRLKTSGGWFEFKPGVVDQVLGGGQQETTPVAPAIPAPTPIPPAPAPVPSTPAPVTPKGNKVVPVGAAAQPTAPVVPTVPANPQPQSMSNSDLAGWRLFTGAMDIVAPGAGRVLDLAATASQQPTPAPATPTPAEEMVQVTGPDGTTYLIPRSQLQQQAKPAPKPAKRTTSRGRK